MNASATGDTVPFAEFVERNICLYQIRSLYPRRPSAAASWICRSLAEALRLRKAVHRKSAHRGV